MQWFSERAVGHYPKVGDGFLWHWSPAAGHHTSARCLRYFYPPSFAGDFVKRDWFWIWQISIEIISLLTTYLFLILMLGTGQNEIIYLTQRATISKIPAQHDFGDIRFQNKLWSGFPRFMFKDHWRVHVHTNPTPSSPAVPHIPILS